jgi:hypothetical protein
MQKKVLWSILIALVLVIVVALFFLIKDKNNQTIQTCNPYSDLNSISVDDQITSCDCLKNTLERDQCRVSISNATLYAKALKDVNTDICLNITSLEVKDACLVNTKAMAKFMNPYQKTDLIATSSNKVN